jgi:hypothetical protein
MAIMAIEVRSILWGTGCLANPEFIRCKLLLFLSYVGFALDNHCRTGQGASAHRIAKCQPQKISSQLEINTAAIYALKIL